ncbi:hypothetical protein SmJEL517_g00992 [Synchytrium microbalum]|uniref:Peroxisomal ATPase PEX6 n=1 Tax=Synchytrium microbalum TaxID=1806994 RepID=A0A507CCZ7_9FUNG|nr:uncharacterized protein SmJEL517_g00992 [Synchytrium microbalum]TPX37218.1 hypothetical protein SmJEL517_g00992 [Synchytrium microbalum]
MITRQSSVLSIPASSPAAPALHRYRVLSASPVLQGLVTLSTRIVISKALALEPPSLRHHIDKEELDVKSFLNTKIITGEAAGSEAGLRYLLDSSLPGSNGIKLDTEALKQPLPISTLQPTPPEDEDEEIRIIVPLLVLAELGVFSGSWVLVSTSSTTAPRLCRIYGIDDGNSKNIPRKAYLPPSLYFNLGSPTQILVSAALLPHDAMPAPIATEVTLARVASPVSNDKKGLDAALDSLKRWFESAVRILCEGDVLSVVIDEEERRLKGIIEDELDDDDAMIDCEPTEDTRQVAYFKVTKTFVENGTSLFASIRIHPSETKLLQQGVANTKIPSSIRKYLHAGAAPDPPPQRTDPAFTTLRSLMAVSLHPAAALLDLGCSILVYGPRGVGKRALASAAADSLGIHIMEVACFDLVGDSDSKTEASLERAFDRAEAAVPCVLVLRNAEALAKKSDVAETGQEPKIASVLAACLRRAGDVSRDQGLPLLVVGTTSDPDKLPTSIRTAFRHEVVVESPAEPARLFILKNLLSQIPLGPDADLDGIAAHTAALNSRDLKDLVSRAAAASIVRVIDSLGKSVGRNGVGIVANDDDLARAGVAIVGKDFDKALGKARAAHSDSIGAPKIPNVTWDDVGGLAHAKRAVLDTIQLPLEHPELFAGGVKKRSGILLYGPPGTGKTLMAKAVATTLSLNFLSVKGPELLNMYIGESEANVRKVFQRARDARPCVVFFDELDSVAPKRGAKGDSGGVMDRIVSQLLAELDSIGGGAGGDVFVIGATNRPDLLDSALLRPGRFDKLLYLGVASDRDSQVKLLQALTRKFTLAPGLDLTRVAEKCPYNYTGADFYALCSDSMLKAMIRRIDLVDAKIAAMNASPQREHPHPVTPAYFFDRIATPEDVTVMVDEEDFEAAQRELSPSVPMAELKRYEEVRKKFEDIPADEVLPVSSSNGGATVSEISFSLGNGDDSLPKPVSSGGGPKKGNQVVKKKKSGDAFKKNQTTSSINNSSGAPAPPVSATSPGNKSEESDEEFFPAPNASNPEIVEGKGKGKAT